MGSATVARRIASLRCFAHWAVRQGLLDADPTLRLRSPRVVSDLPRVADSDRLNEALDTLNRVADDPIAVRDVAAPELLYGSGLRVSEVCSIDVGDIDHERRTVRVLGKGAKQRVVPLTVPASRAIQRWTSVRATLANPDECALLVGSRGRRLTCGSCDASSTRPPQPSRACPNWLPRTAPQHGQPCSRAARTCATSSSCWAMPVWPAPRSTPMSPQSGCARPTRMRIPVLEPDLLDEASLAEKEAAQNAAALSTLWQAYKDTGDRSKRDRLIVHYAPLVKHVAGRVRPDCPTTSKPRIWSRTACSA